MAVHQLTSGIDGSSDRAVLVLHESLERYGGSMTDDTRDSPLKTLDPHGRKETTIIPPADELDTDVDTDAEPHAGDISPHFGGRAQPGDVLGLETGGETTSIGDTLQDENERRRELEEQAAKKRDDERAARNTNR
jgi:hypothetical protein